MAAINRRGFLAYFSAIGLSGTVFPGVLYGKIEEGSPITTEVIAAAERISGLNFRPEEREMMVQDLQQRLEEFESIRALDLPNELPPALLFDPVRIANAELPADEPPRFPEIEATRPTDEQNIAFSSIRELGAMLKSREITSVELTALYLSRLREFDPELEVVITLTQERAMHQARRADEELDRGEWRGPLHGIPYGAKDLFAVEGYPTTWGAVPYQHQIIDTTATVIEKLDRAGAVLVAKLTMGALAWGDVWFGGTTKNPWNPEQGASGSSAGSGAAVSAGLVSFALGTETLGSIVSPSTRNAVTGHRPTFGAVSRYGAMALSWSMDKVGPMARSAEDCAIVYDAIRGLDHRDPSSRSIPFPFDLDATPGDIRVGFDPELFDYEGNGARADQETLDVLRNMGVELQEIDWPTDHPLSALIHTHRVEAAAAFDDLTRERGVDEMVRQERDAWPHVFRAARFTPAVEYIQICRARTKLIQDLHEVMSDIDVLVTPSYQGGVLAATNMTGHPCVVIPNRFDSVEGAVAAKDPGSVSFIGALNRDDAALLLAHLYQQETDFHLRRPPVS